MKESCIICLFLLDSVGEVENKDFLFIHGIIVAFAMCFCFRELINISFSVIIIYFTSR